MKSGKRFVGCIVFERIANKMNMSEKQITAILHNETESLLLEMHYN